MREHFYVKAVQRRGRTIAYAVYDDTTGVETECQRYTITDECSWQVALHLANKARDDRNAGIA